MIQCVCVFQCERLGRMHLCRCKEDLSGCIFSNFTLLSLHLKNNDILFTM